MAPGHVGDLDMRISAAKIARVLGEIAFGNLAVIEIELQRDVLMPDAIEDRNRLACGVEEITGIVARVERLDQKGHALRRRVLGRALQIGDVDRFLHRPLVADRKTGKNMDLPAIQRLRIGQRGGDAGVEIGLAPELRREAPIAGLGVAHRRIEQHDLDAGSFGPRRDIGGGEIIRRLELHRAETRLARCGEAVQERKLGEQGAEIGREIRHDSGFRNGRAEASVYRYWDGNKGMTESTLATGPRLDEDDAGARLNERRRFRGALFLSGLAHGLAILVLILLWQPTTDETVPLPPIAVTVIPDKEGQSGAAGGGNGDTAASSSSTASTAAATAAPSQTPPAEAQQEQPQQHQTQPVEVQPAPPAAPVPTPTEALRETPSPTAIEPAQPPQTPEPVPPHKPAPPRPKPPPTVVAQAPPTPPTPQPPAAPAVQAPPAPSTSTSGAPQGAESPLPAGVGGQGRGEQGRGLAEVGNGSATGTADDYLAKVRLWILRFAKTPDDDCSRQHGAGKMDVTYHRDGTVLDVHITESSGCPASDAEAVRMVKAASPLPPIPDRFPGDPKTLGLPFDFRPGLLDRLFHGG